MADPARGHELSETLTASSGAAGPGESGFVQGRLPPGTRVDRYEVIELLGEGSMGRVYRARDTNLGREVALKRIQPGQWDVLTAQIRLRREAQAMARVEHAAVIRIYDVPVVNGELFVAMELARGGTLAAWTRARPRRWREVVRIFLEAGGGLAAAHQAGLVHRDIKPSNILLDGHGRAKIGDFGLARMFGVAEDDDGAALPPAGLDVRITHTGAIAGTLAYMAPEQLAGGSIDARADQFAFCVALWEALCGRRPFPAVQDAIQSPGSLVEAISAGPVEGPRPGVRVPRRILALVRRGLSVDRTWRWGSMDELLGELERAARPRQAWWVAGAAGLIVGVALIVGLTRSTERAVPVVCGKRDQIAAIWNPEVRARYLSGAVTPTALEDAGWFDWYAHELDAAYTVACGRTESQRIACLDEAVDDLGAAIGRTERPYWPRLRAIDRCGATVHEQVAGDIGYGEVALLSPDGRQLATSDVGRRSSTLREIGSNSSSPLDLAFALRWLGDGTIAGLGDHGQITVIDPATHRAIRALEVGRNVVDVSPDLDRVARLADGKLSIVPIAGGAPIVEPVAFLEGAGRFSPDDRRFATLTAPENPTLYIDDLVSKHREVLAFRARLLSIGRTPVRWLDPVSFVISGSATSEIAGDVWRVRVDASGNLAGPPQILRRGERDTALVPQDARAGKLLLARIGVATQTTLIDGESRSALPSSAARLHPVAVDGAHRRVLGALDGSDTRWAWMSPDGSIVEPIAVLDGLHSAAARASGLSALDLRRDPPVYVAFDEVGAELARVPIEAARGAIPTLRCGVSRCAARWVAGGVAFVARIEGRTVGAPVRLEPPSLAITRLPWELSPDGERIAFATAPYSKTLEVYDLEHAVMRHVTSAACEHVQRAWFLPEGAFVLAGLARRSDSRFEFVLVRRDATGGEHILWRGAAWVAGGVPLDDHRMILCTLSSQFSLVLSDAR